MGRDVTFYGQWSLSRDEQAIWRRRRVGVTALRGWEQPFCGRLDAFAVGEFLDGLPERFDGHVMVSSTGRAIRAAGQVEALTFWESLAGELAGLVAAAAKAGHTAWVLVEDADQCLRLVSDGRNATHTGVTAAGLNKARRSPAHALLDHLSLGMSKETWIAVEAAAEAAVHGTDVEFATTGDVEDVFALVEAASERQVKFALARADQIPRGGSFVKPARLFRTKASLLQAARSSKKVEQRAVCIDVASHLDPERCALLCLAWLSKKKVPRGLRAGAARAVGRARSDAALEGLLGLVYQKASTQDRTDPVAAALHALASSPHPRAAERTIQALPDMKGKRGDECFSRAAYVAVAQPAPESSGYFSAIAAEPGHRHKYTAEAVVACLAGGHRGNLLALCFPR